MVCRPGHENDPVEKMRHSCAHVMASAVCELFPGTKVTIGPCIDNGFYYDFDTAQVFTPEDLQKIEGKMKEIIQKNLPFVRKEISRDEAISLFKKKGEKYKVEIIEGLPAGEVISLYEHGSFVDLCRGPHVAKTGEIKAFHLTSVAGSYWRGDEKRERLQRIYGTAFASDQALKEYLQQLEEAVKRDHRKLGKELDLYTFHPEAPASPFFLPKGALIYRLLIDYIRGFYQRDGYSEVITPEILDVELWKRSGHFDHFRENMYFTSDPNQRADASAEGATRAPFIDHKMAVKPMNCPGHCLMYAEKQWSYRDLPVRFADFGRLHRFERSGVTHGLTRVRTFSQDDAHIFCTHEQMDEEISSFIKLVWEIYHDFAFESVTVAVATRPKNFQGEKKLWDEAEEILKKSLEKAQVTFTINEGEGAFYGPKIEFQVKDALNRAWQLGTLQVDFSMPERFDLNYVTSAGTKARPVMLHRAVLGSLERFIGILVEHCGGAFPLWLAPVQILLIPISTEQSGYAKEMQRSLEAGGVRVEIDARNEKLGLKIREAQLKKVPYMAVMGGKELMAQVVSVRHRKVGDLGTMTVADLTKRLQEEVRNKT